MTSAFPVYPRGFFYAGRPLASGARDTGRLCSGMQWATPICLGLASSESNTLQDDPNDLSNLFQAIESVRVPVYIRVGLDVNSYRSTAALAITNAQAQMSYYNTLFLNLGLSTLLGGFWFEWDTSTQFPSDGSRYTNAQLNTLITLAHNTYNVPVVVVSPNPGTIFSPSSGSFSRTYPNPVASPNVITLLGENSGYDDWIVFKNPFQPQNPVFSPIPSTPLGRLDLSRFMGLLALANQISSVNLKVSSVQCLNLEPYLSPEEQFPSDQSAGIFLRPSVRDALINMVNFSRFCGLPLSFAADPEIGRLTNTIIPNYLTRTSLAVPCYTTYGTLQVANEQIVVAQGAGNNNPAHTGTFSNLGLGLISLA